MRSILLVLMFVSLGVQANWAEQMDPRGPAQPIEGGGSLPVLIGSATDPIGDAFGTDPFFPNLDISGLSAYLQGGNIAITMEFDTPIAPADASVPESLIGFIDIDVDQNPLTGVISSSDIFCPQPTQLGVEYTLSLGTVVGNQVQLFDGNFIPVGVAPISFTSNSFTIQLPTAMIGNPSNVHMASVIGTSPEPTDCVPDNAILAAGFPPAVPVPTLSQWMLLVLALVIMAFTTQKIRRSHR